jgi:lipopolysaccharide biosynthesis glycosyltransferase
VNHDDEQAGVQTGVRAPSTVLVSAADDAYALPAALALLSAATSSPGRPPCLLLGVGLSGATAAAVERAFDRAGVVLTVRPAPALPDVASLPAGLPTAACARLALPEVAGDLAERCLYLDADTLTTAPVDALLATSLGGVPFAAVPDSAIPSVSYARLGVKGWQRLGIHPDAPFFNTGVLLVDNRRWQEERIGARTFEQLRAGETAAWEQGALNAAAPGRWLALDARWNHQVRNSFELALAGRSLTKSGLRPPAPPGILHFTGRSKPWQAAYPPNPARAAYLRAWRRHLAGSDEPRTRGRAAWVTARLAGRMAERDAPRTSPGSR